MEIVVLLVNQLALNKRFSNKLFYWSIINFCSSQCVCPWIFVLR